MKGAAVKSDAVSAVDTGRVEALLASERERFAAARPRCAALAADARRVMPAGVPNNWQATMYLHGPVFAVAGRGSRFTDADGHEYADFNIADTSVFCGHAPEPTTRAVAARMAAGAQFLLPAEDAIAVAAELGRRYRLAQWQFTLSATVANVEAMRVARAATGRPRAVLFDGHYHGHADELQAALDDAGRVGPEFAGVPAAAVADVRIVPFNDPDAVAAALADGSVACVLTEPAMTNNQGVIQPLEGFHTELRRLTRDAGTLLVIDETHTQVCGPGGLCGRLGLEPDMVTLGKSIGGGVPVGAYGMTADLARVFDGEWGATGGTLFGSALQMAACRATLDEVLTDAAYAHAARLGGRLADGIERVAADAGLPWRAHRLYARSGYCFGGRQPRDAVEGRADLDRPLWRLMRVWAANRGVWEAIEGAGPAASVATTDDDVDRYLDVLADLVAALTR